MDSTILLLALLTMLPIVFLVLAYKQKRRLDSELKLRKLLLRIGRQEHQALSLQDFLRTQEDKRWFRFVVNKFKQAGLVERKEIVRLLLAQLALVIIALGLLVMNFSTLAPKPLLVAAILPMLPMAYLLLKASQRQAQLRKDFPEMLDSIVRSLQAGYGIDGALQAVAEDTRGPLGEEMMGMIKQLKLGLSLRDLLREFQVRVSLPEAQFFAITLILQRESGGQLTSILKELSRLMRRRESFQAKLRTLTAESRFTALFIGGMPLAYLGYKLLFDYASMAFFLQDPTGIKLLSISVVLILLGSLILRSMLRIRF